jgi:hypothetical protein
MVLFKRLISVAAGIALMFVTIPSQAAATIDTQYVEGTDEAAALYNPLVVNQLDLQMPQSTIDGLNGSTNYWGNEGPYLPATLSGVVNGVPFASMDVGVHLKGAWGSWRNIYGKAGFKIKIDFKNKNASLYGVTKLTLNNMVQDHSSVHESMSYRLFRSVGVPTARTGYANVSVNGQNYGLHLNLETLDTKLMAYWGITPTHIYKGGVPYFPDLYSSQIGLYAIDQGSLTDTSDLLALTHVVDQGNGPNWYSRMSAVADLEEMTLDWASEKFTGHWDGYVNNHNNFYLVSRQDGKFIMLPWGMDQTWNGGLDYNNGAALFSQCLADTQCLNLYHQALVKVVHSASELNLPQMNRNIAAVINPSLIADPRKEFGAGEIPGDQSASRNFITSQISNGLGMISSYDVTLNTFSAIGYGQFGVKDTLTVPNATNAITLTGRAYSASATVNPSNLTPLAVGLNLVPLAVHIGAINKTYQLNVYRRGLYTKTANVVFAAGKSTLNSLAAKAVKALADSAMDGQNAVLTVKMQRPANMTSKNASSLLRSRYAGIQTALNKAGITPTSVTLIITTVKGANTLALSLKFEK